MDNENAEKCGSDNNNITLSKRSDWMSALFLCVSKAFENVCKCVFSALKCFMRRFLYSAVRFDLCLHTVCISAHMRIINMYVCTSRTMCESVFLWYVYVLIYAICISRYVCLYMCACIWICKFETRCDGKNSEKQSD